jgi:hypothetical protein
MLLLNNLSNSIELCFDVELWGVLISAFFIYIKGLDTTLSVFKLLSPLTFLVTLIIRLFHLFKKTIIYFVMI